MALARAVVLRRALLWDSETRREPRAGRKDKARAAALVVDAEVDVSVPNEELPLLPSREGLARGDQAEDRQGVAHLALCAGPMSGDVSTNENEGDESFQESGYHGRRRLTRWAKKGEEGMSVNREL